MLSILFYSTNWSKLSMLFFFWGVRFFTCRTAHFRFEALKERRNSLEQHRPRAATWQHCATRRRWQTEMVDNGGVINSKWENHAKNHRKNMEQSWVFNQSGHKCATLTRELYFHKNLRDGRCAFENHWKGIPYPEVVLKASRNEGLKVPVLWYHPSFTTERNGTKHFNYVFLCFFLAQVLVYLLMVAWLMRPDWCWNETLVDV